MQVAASPLQSVPVLPPGIAGASGEGVAGSGQKPSPLRNVAASAPAAAAAEAAPAATDTVVLSPPAQALDSGDALLAQRNAPVYAEVWKDGMKIAEIDSHGDVTSPLGQLAPTALGGTGGAWLAAVRASQVAQAVGGEIRVAGQAIDAATLKMRVRLQTTYGV